MKSEKVIAPCPPSDGREWDVQCARCGSSCVRVDCDYCGGEGYTDADEWEDEDFLRPCDVCETRGGYWACCSSSEWCVAHPHVGREHFKRGTLEWFTFDPPRQPVDAPGPASSEEKE